MRRALVIALVLLLAGAAPASAAPDNSPVFVKEAFEAYFPILNPCIEEEELAHFTGHLLIHEFENPKGKTHYNDLGYIAASTPSGFSSPEKMIGVDVENINGNTQTFTGTGLYQLRNDDGQKLRFQIKVQFTLVGDEVKVDLFGLDSACLGNTK
jgi:hypothetical protein